MPATSSKRKRSLIRRLLGWFLFLVAAFYGLATLGFVALRWINPPFTTVHVERRIESWFHRGAYRKRYEFVPLDSISPAFQHAVIAAEDARFFHHHGFDWHEVHEAVEDGLDDGKLRGASTIDEQLAKNLFLTTHRSLLRKGLEVTLVPLEELILPKRRILELYLNVVEWGPGVYGAEAAARYHYGVPASRIGRDQGARLAAILPSPRHRLPARMTRYTARILTRMDQMGW